MATLWLLTLVLRWVHVLAAILLMGGSLFLRFALMPAAATLSAETRQQLAAAVRARWAVLVMLAIGLLLVSGLANYSLAVVRSAMPGSYHAIFGIKFLLALTVFWIASLLIGRSDTAERVRQKAGFWLTLNLVLATLVVCLGGVLRFTNRKPLMIQPTSVERSVEPIRRTDETLGRLAANAAVEQQAPE